jgi:hypothetical protein
MEAIRINKLVEKDGEISLTGLPYKKGQHLEMIILPESSNVPEGNYMTVKDLLESGLVGIWKDRKDIKDSAVYARKLREQAQRRRR